MTILFHRCQVLHKYLSISWIRYKKPAKAMPRCRLIQLRCKLQNLNEFHPLEPQLKRNTMIFLYQIIVLSTTPILKARLILHYRICQVTIFQIWKTFVPMKKAFKLHFLNHIFRSSYISFLDFPKFIPMGIYILSIVNPDRDADSGSIQLLHFDVGDTFPDLSLCTSLYFPVRTIFYLRTTYSVGVS